MTTTVTAARLALRIVGLSKAFDDNVVLDGIDPEIAGATSDARQPAIVTTGLCKSFGETVVLDGVDMSVAAGTIFALLGPNGAGKTTIVRILSTLIPAGAGGMSVAGHDVRRDPDKVRAAIGVTGQFSAVDELLTGEENLRLMADLNHLGRAAGRRRVDRAARPVRSRRRGTQAGLDVLRRHAPPARPGDDARRLLRR